jgi:hypothetical protein
MGTFLREKTKYLLNYKVVARNWEYLRGGRSARAKVSINVVRLTPKLRQIAILDSCRYGVSFCCRWTARSDLATQIAG